MYGKHVDAPSAVHQEQPKPLVRSWTKTGIFHQCLVVSANAARGEALASTATDHGWNTVVCSDVCNARAASRRMRFQLALVDLERRAGGTPGGFRELTEQLALTRDLLVVVCGHEEAPNEETWARQIGAWLYLPGLRQVTEISSICRDAIAIARRLSMPSTVMVLEERD